MDVLENPFVRLRYFLEPGDLLAEAHAHGFDLHNSWPRYDSGFEVHWFKRRSEPAESLARRRDFVTRSRLSYLVGRPLFLVEVDADLGHRLVQLLEDVDALVDSVQPDRAHRCAVRLEELSALIRSDAVLAEPTDRARAVETLTSLRRLVELLETGSADEIAGFCSTDAAFLSAWGSPAHFAAFRCLAS